MHEEEVKKLQAETFVLEKKKSKFQEDIYRAQVRLQEINTRLTEILEDDWKVRTATSDLNMKEFRASGKITK